ncbi:MAG: class II D-tagatose-bisphosphate aldolase, non-catalytic subunit [Paracoccus sp. (in: a-proteobacteria)]|uniref:class II D-tagatose-bisphosphate aldolase non-catalytic subunit n=1 Tax=Paracoccus sp. TaxID=267 RepID=UPI0039E236DF
MSDLLTPIIRAVRKQMGPAIPAVCSAQPDVIAAGLRLARHAAMPALIEATSNQVNQFGGYSGMTPGDFAAFLRDVAAEHDLGDVPVILGGSHLGPQAWRAMPAEAAMAHAELMVADYVRAGFTKIHLDCFPGCQDEAPRLDDDLAAARAARLVRVAEAHAPDPEALCYVIGTSLRGTEETTPQPPDEAARMLAAHEAAFAEAGAASAWKRLRGLVAQPGLGFGATQIDRFDMSQPDLLSPVLDGNERLGFEAHGTDYQPAPVYPDLTRRNFAIFKVGPALSFAWREALYALSHIREWMDGSPHISQGMEDLMLERPELWQSHYHGPARTQRLLRHFSYADRIRYYWPQARAQVQELCDSLDATGVPQPLLLQYLPPETLARAARLDLPPARAILQAHVEETLIAYYPEETC